MSLAGRPVPNTEAALPLQWAAEIPTTANHLKNTDTMHPYVLLEEAAGGLAVYTIVQPWEEPEWFSREAVRAPYIGNDPQRGLSKECVGIEPLDVKDLTIADDSIDAATRFWKSTGVTAAFCQSGEAQAYGRTALICFADGTHTVCENGRAFEVTSYGIVLATARVVTQRARWQLAVSATP